MYNIEKIKEDLKNNLSEFRFEHSLLVAMEAKKLANHYNFDEDKAYIAGLVHDIAKDFTDEENSKWIKEYNLSDDMLSTEYKDIVHGIIGSLAVKKWYNLDDDICNAVRYHTIGNVPMSILDKIVFLADKIARKKTNPIIEKERILAYQNLDSALIFCLEHEKEMLENIGKKMHSTSLDLLEYLKNEI